MLFGGAGVLCVNVYFVLCGLRARAQRSGGVRASPRADVLFHALQARPLGRVGETSAVALAARGREDHSREARGAALIIIAYKTPPHHSPETSFTADTHLLAVEASAQLRTPRIDSPPVRGLAAHVKIDMKGHIISNSRQRAHKGPLAAVHDQRALVCASELCDRLEKSSPPRGIYQVAASLFR
jgi:hypothetical protein